jgi:hypothetical protein
MIQWPEALMPSGEGARTAGYASANLAYAKRPIRFVIFGHLDSVIASGAKQSTARHVPRVDGLLRCARNDGESLINAPTELTSQARAPRLSTSRPDVSL